MKKEKPDWIFKCCKCEHYVYIDKERLKNLFEFYCPECGEEPDENWILVSEGDFKKR